MPCGEVSDRFIDGMAAIMAVKVKETWQEYAHSFLEYCMPKNTSKVGKLFIVFDSYRNSSIKQLTQLRRGTPGRNIYITNIKQKMPKSGDWNNCLRNGHNKTEMIKALVQYYKTDDEVHTKFNVPIIVTEEEKTWSLTATGVEQLPSSNHIEADAIIILEASKSSNTVIVRGADTDILVLLCYTHSILNCVNRWVMKIDSERFVDINIIRGHYGNDICKILPAYHSLTGCDSTSYPVNVGKIKPFKKLIREDKASLLSEFGSSA